MFRIKRKYRKKYLWKYLMIKILNLNKYKIKRI